MNLEYLEDLLSKVEYLNTTQYAEAEKLKTKAAEALRALFPTELVNAGNVDRLNFKVEYAPSTIANEIKHFNEVKNKLIAILEAKIDLLKYKPKPQAASPLLNKQFDFAKEKVAYLTKISELSNFNKAQDNTIVELNNKIKDLEVALIKSKKWRSKLDLGIWIALVLAIFGAGAGSVSLKIDYDKRRLQEEVDAKNIIIKNKDKEIQLLKKPNK